MKITIDVIAEALKEYQPVVQLSSFNRQYSRIRLANSEEWDPGILYILNGGKTPHICGIKNSGLICIGKPNASPDETSDLIILPENYDIYEIFNYIQNIFDAFTEFKVNLLNASNTGSYKEIIDIGWKFIKNPLFLQESGHRIIALAPETDIPSDPEWDFLRVNRFIPIESIQKLKRDSEKYTSDTPPILGSIHGIALVDNPRPNDSLHSILLAKEKIEKSESVKNAKIIAKCKGFKKRKTRTDDFGRYTLTGLEDGRWELKLMAKGYEEVTAIVDISGGGEYEQNF